METTKLKKMFLETGADALISEAYQTRLWFAKIETTDGFLIIEKDLTATLFVDGRYIEHAKAKAKNVEVKLLVGDSMEYWLREKRFRTIALESNYLTKDIENKIVKIAYPEEIKWINGQELRIIKDSEELKLIQKAVDISLKAYNELILWIRPGMTEKQVGSYLNFLLRKHGAEKESFSEIVATGENSAEPHHHPSDKELKYGTLLKIDFGALYHGYSADITRTFIFQDPTFRTPTQNPKMQEILNIVEEAAKLGRKAVQPGCRASDIDRICRNYITEKGYGDYFVHSTGHGLGIDVHELPNVNRVNDTILEPGMVITVEPGIYIEGLGGARIEDDVLVTNDGFYVFSRPNERK